MLVTEVFQLLTGAGGIASEPLAALSVVLVFAGLFFLQGHRAEAQLPTPSGSRPTGRGFVRGGSRIAFPHPPRPIGPVPAAHLLPFPYNPKQGLTLRCGYGQAKRASRSLMTGRRPFRLQWLLLPVGSDE